MWDGIGWGAPLLNALQRVILTAHPGHNTTLTAKVEFYRIVLVVHSQLAMYLTQGFGNQKTSHPVYGNNSHIKYRVFLAPHLLSSLCVYSEFGMLFDTFL